MAAIKEPLELDSSILTQLFISRVEDTKQMDSTVSPRMLIALLAQGVGGDVLPSITKYIPKSLVIRAIGSTPTNFSKLFYRKRLSKHQTEALYSLTKLWAELREFFVWNDCMVNQWINQQLPAFDGASPLELMSSQEGQELIKRQLQAMRYGNFD